MNQHQPTDQATHCVYIAAAPPHVSTAAGRRWSETSCPEIMREECRYALVSLRCNPWEMALIQLEASATVLQQQSVVRGAARNRFVTVVVVVVVMSAGDVDGR